MHQNTRQIEKCSRAYARNFFWNKNEQIKQYTPEQTSAQKTLLEPMRELYHAFKNVQKMLDPPEQQLIQKLQANLLQHPTLPSAYAYACV